MSDEVRELQNKVHHLAYVRYRHAKAKEHVAQLRERWQEENRGILTLETDLAHEAITLEAAIREKAVALFRETGEKKLPLPGVGIRMVTTVEYDPVAAFEWAVQHGKFLSLDERLFQKHAKAVAKTDPLPFVTLVEEPQVTIAKDLPQATIAKDLPVVEDVAEALPFDEPPLPDDYDEAYLDWAAYENEWLAIQEDSRAKFEQGEPIVADDEPPF